MAFLDFEASSLGKNSYPIEVAWVFDNGEAESFLIRPAPTWTDWAAEAEAVHGLSRQDLIARGTAHDWIALHMLTVLRGVELYASAPSWDGKWLSRLLRASGIPRHALRLRDTEEAQRRSVLQILATGGVPPDRRGGVASKILAAVSRESETGAPPAHRALADAQHEWRLWQAACARAREQADDAGAEQGRASPPR